MRHTSWGEVIRCAASTQGILSMVYPRIWWFSLRNLIICGWFEIHNARPISTNCDTAVRWIKNRNYPQAEMTWLAARLARRANHDQVVCHSQSKRAKRRIHIVLNLLVVNPQRMITLHETHWVTLHGKRPFDTARPRNWRFPTSRRIPRWVEVYIALHRVIRCWKAANGSWETTNERLESRLLKMEFLMILTALKVKHGESLSKVSLVKPWKSDGFKESAYTNVTYKYNHIHVHDHACCIDLHCFFNNHINQPLTIH